MNEENIKERFERRGFYVADWHVQPLLHRVSRSGKTEQVEPKLIDVLVYLAQNAGAVVTRDQILDEVWPDTIVTDHALTRSISEIRKVFDDSPKDPSIIETIPKTGYRLVAPVTFEEISSDGLSTDSPSIDVSVPGAAPGAAPRRSYLAIAITTAAAAVLIAGVFAARSVLTAGPSVSVVSRPLTTLPGREIQPAFSPDGTMLAFVWAKELYETQRQIYVKHLNDESAAPISSGEGQDMFPAWSPDGKRIAFIRNYNADCAIFTVSTLGTSEQKLLDCPFDITELDWSPDGKYLTFVGPFNKTEPQRVYLLDVETRAYRSITDPPRHYPGDDLPSFSPDGRRLSFVRYSAMSVNDLYTVQIDDPEGTLKRVTDDGQHIYAYDWMPGGQEIVFSSNRNGLYRVWRVSPSAGANSVRSADDISAWDPGQISIAPAGNSLAFVEWFFDVNIREFPMPSAEPFEPRTLIASTRTDADPVFSPDGRRIAFVSSRSGANEIWVAASDGSHPLMLTSLGRPATRGPAWSPDGRNLAFTSRDRVNSTIQVVDAEGGVPQVVFADTSSVTAPAWSLDGRTLFFGSNRTGRVEIWKVSLEEGAIAEQVTTEGAAGVAVSPRGNTLYLTREKEPGLWAFSPSTGVQKNVVGAAPGTRWAAWTITVDGVYFLERIGGLATLKFFAFENETTSEIMSVPCTVMENGAGIEISADRSSMITSCIDRADSDLMLVEGFR